MKQIFFSDESSFLIHCLPLTLHREKEEIPLFVPRPSRDQTNKQTKQSQGTEDRGHLEEKWPYPNRDLGK